MKLIFDIGGNKGKWTKKHIKIYQDAKFVYVEPNPKLFKEAKSTFDKDKVNCYNKAVSCNPNDLKLWVCNEDSGASSVSENYMKNSVFTSKSDKWLHPETGKIFSKYYTYQDEPVTVSTITMDKLIEENGNPDLIKIDVEGSEADVMKSLSSKSGKITFEWHEPLINDVYESVEHLSTIGYTKFGTLIWHASKDESDAELPEEHYKSKEDFITMLKEKVKYENKWQPNKDNQNAIKCVQRWGMVWAK